MKLCNKTQILLGNFSHELIQSCKSCEDSTILLLQLLQSGCEPSFTHYLISCIELLNTTPHGYMIERLSKLKISDGHTPMDHVNQIIQQYKSNNVASVEIIGLDYYTCGIIEHTRFDIVIKTTYKNGSFQLFSHPRIPSRFSMDDNSFYRMCGGCRYYVGDVIGVYNTTDNTFIISVVTRKVLREKYWGDVIINKLNIPNKDLHYINKLIDSGQHKLAYKLSNKYVINEDTHTPM